MSALDYVTPFGNRWVNGTIGSEATDSPKLVMASINAGPPVIHHSAVGHNQLVSLAPKFAVQPMVVVAPKQTAVIAGSIETPVTPERRSTCKCPRRRLKVELISVNIS